MNTTLSQASIEADPEVPQIHIRRDFRATHEQLMKCHLDPALFARWVGPASLTARIDYWDAKTGGSWRYIASRDDGEFAFRGCFHFIGERKIVQTFTWEGQPDDVSLETLEFTDLGNGMTRLHARSLCDSFAGRDAWLKSGMESGVNEGYEKLDRLLNNGIS
ncbi:MAG: SRPBCC domain-containing protein [Actinomycetota bacterium]|nr:SRPBCC domain-containing protein [Actinomycetota bacterium]MDP2287613.1 SRPBCC domain-containing protein [Actinomycetota bacterium]